MTFRTLNVTLLRHGLPEGENCLRGSTDFPITDVGLRQMESAVQVDASSFQHIISSPLHRCLHFADRLAQRNKANLCVTKSWMEMNFGDWDGRPVDWLWQNDAGFRQFQENPWQAQVPGGEQTREFDQRVSEAWAELVSETENDGVLVVTHAGVMKQLLRQIWRMPEDCTYLSAIALPYAARIDISVYIDGDSVCPVVKWPSHCHPNKNI